jgi:spore coat polysaccharide biosynthesis predicted glycosyltransferase SpsG
LECELAGSRGLSQVDVLVVDDPSPQHEHAWLVRARRAGRPCAAIHDCGIGSDAADVIVDGSVTVRPSRPGATGLSGPRFTVLDPQVIRARAARRRRRARRRQRVLIALGGGSHIFSVVRSLVDDIARRCPDASITVAAGFSQRNRPALGAARWIDRPDGLARDLAEADVAVVGGGMTLYESCAIGVPTVAIAVVPAQCAAIEAFAARHAAIDAGRLSEKRLVVTRAGAGVARLLRDVSARRLSFSAGRRLVDGRGVFRIAAQLRLLAAAAAARSGRA